MALEQISVGTKEQYIDLTEIAANKKVTHTEINDIVTKTNLAITQVNNNQQAIQDEFVYPTDDLQVFITNNRLVNLGAGTFVINAALTIPSNTKIVGVRGSSILKLTTGTKIIDLSSLPVDVSIENVTFEGKTDITKAVMAIADVKNRVGEGTDVGIYCTGIAENIHVNNCEFRNFDLAGVHLINTNRPYHSKTFKFTDCIFRNSWYGALYDIRSEYITTIGCTYATNQIGCFIAGGNNYMSECQFNSNSVNCAISGTAGENDSHGSIGTSSFNHALSYGLCIFDINVGFTFTGCQAFEAPIYIDAAKGFSFVGGQIASTVTNVNPVTAAINLIHSTIFLDFYGGGTISDYTSLDLKNNRFIDGSSSTALNN